MGPGQGVVDARHHLYVRGRLSTLDRSIGKELNAKRLRATFLGPYREASMSAVRLSSKYQVVIPPDIRRAFRLAPGQRMEVIVHEGRITLVPLGPMRALRGMARGIDTRVPRDADRA